ncbi:MAG: GDSL-type esterase/lipase family protein, partial [Thermoleophilia bacterium]|nr:GDSL-type esterase/lipase family protein [Thermoleophilia bacterium]
MFPRILLIFALMALAGVVGCSGDDDIPEPTEGLSFTLQMQPRTIGPTEDRVRVPAPGPDYRAIITISDNRRDDEPDAETVRRRRECRDGDYYFMAAGNDSERGEQADGCRLLASFEDQGEFTTWVEIRGDDGEVVAGSDTQPARVRDFLIVSLGDSVASGEGNPDQGRLRTLFGDETVWQDRQCHRSFRAGSAQAALEIESADPDTTVTFLHLACSGARITTGLLREYRGIESGDPLPPQIAQLRALLEDPGIGGSPEAPREVDALMLTIGANDLRFGTIVQRCLLNDEDEGSCQAAPFRGEETVQQAVDRLLLDLDGRYARLAACLGDGDCEAGEPLGIPSERVLISEYFDPSQSRPGRFCRYPTVPLPRFNLTRNESRWAKASVVDPLNAQVAASAGSFGWTHVDGLSADFGTHGICRTFISRWVLRLSRSVTRQLGVAGAFHPNRRGHSCYRNRFTHALRGTLGDELEGEFTER